MRCRHPRNLAVATVLITSLATISPALAQDADPPPFVNMLSSLDGAATTIEPADIDHPFGLAVPDVPNPAFAETFADLVVAADGFDADAEIAEIRRRFGLDPSAPDPFLLNEDDPSYSGASPNRKVVYATFNRNPLDCEIYCEVALAEYEPALGGLAPDEQIPIPLEGAWAVWSVTNIAGQLETSAIVTENGGNAGRFSNPISTTLTPLDGGRFAMTWILPTDFEIRIMTSGLVSESIEGAWSISTDIFDADEAGAEPLSFIETFGSPAGPEARDYWESLQNPAPIVETGSTEGDAAGSSGDETEDVTTGDEEAETTDPVPATDETGTDETGTDETGTDETATGDDAVEASAPVAESAPADESGGDTPEETEGDGGGLGVALALGAGLTGGAGMLWWLFGRRRDEGDDEDVLLRATTAGDPYAPRNEDAPETDEPADLPLFSPPEPTEREQHQIYLATQEDERRSEAAERDRWNDALVRVFSSAGEQALAMGAPSTKDGWVWVSEKAWTLGVGIDTVDPDLWNRMGRLITLEGGLFVNMVHFDVAAPERVVTEERREQWVGLCYELGVDPEPGLIAFDAAQKDEEDSGPHPGDLQRIPANPNVMGFGLHDPDVEVLSKLQTIIDAQKGTGEIAGTAEALHEFNEWHKANRGGPWFQWTNDDGPGTLVGAGSADEFVACRRMSCFEFVHYCAYLSSDQLGRPSFDGDEHVGFTPAWGLVPRLFRVNVGISSDGDPPRNHVMTGATWSWLPEVENNQAGYYHVVISLGNGECVGLGGDGLVREASDEVFDSIFYSSVSEGPYQFGVQNPVPEDPSAVVHTK